MTSTATASVKFEAVATPAAIMVPSFASVFREHAPYVWRVLRRLGVAEPDVPDVSQEVFLVVHRKLASFEGRASLRSWVFGICVRTAFAHFRKNPLRREVPTYPVPETAVAASQPSALEQKRALALLDGILSRLSPEQRAVYVLYEIEGLSMAEVAAGLDCHIQTAFSRLYAARSEIETALKRMRARGKVI